MDVAVLAGMISTSIFASSTLPMLIKAARTKDLRSYSFGNILLSNVGNAIHSFYVFTLPAGPIWLLHSFYLLSTALMLFWYLRYEAPRTVAATGRRTRTAGSGGRGGDDSGGVSQAGGSWAVAYRTPSRVDPFRWDEFGGVVAEADTPRGVMDPPMVPGTQQDQVGQVRGTTLGPRDDVVRGAPLRPAATAGIATTLVPQHEQAPPATRSR